MLAGCHRKSGARCDLRTKRTCGAACGSPPNWRASCSTSSAGELRAVPYKGPALAQSVYRDLGLRSFSDLDFLISPADFERAKQALAEIGYRPSADLTPAVERLWLRTGYERSFDGAAGKNLVELQWALLPHFYAVDLRVEDLLARAGRTVVAGCEVPCLAPRCLKIRCWCSACTPPSIYGRG